MLWQISMHMTLSYTGNCCTSLREYITHLVKRTLKIRPNMCSAQKERKKISNEDLSGLYFAWQETSVFKIISKDLLSSDCRLIWTTFCRGRDLYTLPWSERATNCPTTTNLLILPRIKKGSSPKIRNDRWKSWIHYESESGQQGRPDYHSSFKKYNKTVYVTFDKHTVKLWLKSYPLGYMQ